MASGCIQARYQLEGGELIRIFIGEKRAHGRLAGSRATCDKHYQDDAVPQLWLRLAGTVTKTISALPNPNRLTTDEHIRLASETLSSIESYIIKESRAYWLPKSGCRYPQSGLMWQSFPGRRFRENKYSRL